MPIDTLFTINQKDLLYKNYNVSIGLNINEPNFVPVVCLQAEKLGYKFLVTQLVPDDDRAVFCLCDYGKENLRLEVIDINEVEEQVKNKGDVLKQDPSFVGKYNLAVYAKVADCLGKIITNDKDEEAKDLFKRFGKETRYQDQNKSARRFRYDLIW